MRRIAGFLVLFLVSLSISGCLKSIPESSFDCSQLNSARAGSEDFSYSGIIEITIQQMSPYYVGDENIDLLFRKRLPWDNAEGKITKAIFLEKLEGYCAQNPRDDMVEAGIEALLALESEISTRPDLAPCYFYNNGLDIESLVEFHKGLLNKYDNNPDIIHSGRLLEYIEEGKYSKAYFDRKVIEFCQEYTVSPIFYGLVNSVKEVDKIKREERKKAYQEAEERRQEEARREEEVRRTRMESEMKVLLRKYDHDLFADGDVSCEDFNAQYDVAEDYMRFRSSGSESLTMIPRKEYLIGFNATLETIKSKLSADSLEVLNLAMLRQTRHNPFDDEVTVTFAWELKESNESSDTPKITYELAYSEFPGWVSSACAEAQERKLPTMRVEDIVNEYAEKRHRKPVIGTIPPSVVVR